MNNYDIVKFDDNCCIEKCKYEKECAQHDSAGDFRAEGGFRPILAKEGERIFCFTKSTEPEIDPDYNFGRTCPKDENVSREFGMVSVKTLTTIRGLEIKGRKKILKNKIAEIIDFPENDNLEQIVAKIGELLEKFENEHQNNG